MESSKSPDLAYPHLKILFSSGTPMAHWTEPDFQASGERGADSPPFSQAFFEGSVPFREAPKRGKPQAEGDSMDWWRNGS